MKIQKYPEKSYSLLRWPVAVKNCPGPLHVTAKWFGDIDLDPMGVQIRVEDFYEEWTPKLFQWKPILFGDLVPVLEFTLYPIKMHKARLNFNFLKDQFEPWRPHITVPKLYWLRVLDQNLTPEGEQLKFGEIELCLGLKNV